MLCLITCESENEGLCIKMTVNIYVKQKERVSSVCLYRFSSIVL